MTPNLICKIEATGALSARLVIFKDGLCIDVMDMPLDASARSNVLTMFSDRIAAANAEGRLVELSADWIVYMVGA